MRVAFTLVCILASPILLPVLWIVGRQEGKSLKQMIREYREDFTL